jgi:starch synthase
MNIVWITSEAHPYAKTGGLADVSFSLPAALARRGHKVSVIMPYYPQITGPLKLKYAARHEMLGVPLGEKNEWAQILQHKLDKNLSFYFIEFNNFFDRPTLYDWDGIEYSDNARRYIFLSRAAMQTILKLKLKPDILHTNDWHSALCNVYLKSDLYWNEKSFKKTRSVLTIHNIGYQGIFHKSNLFWTGLSWDYFNFQCLEFYDQINLLKSGILTADMVNTVSPKYAEEILSPGFSFNLDGPLKHCAARGKLRGIINGIDDNIWNPERDSLIPAHFTSEDLSGKDKCKRKLQKRFGLEQRSDVPLFGTISRLAYQKGFDVYVESLEEMLLTEDIQAIVIGKGEPYLHGRLDDLARRYPGKFAVYIGYSSDELAHLLEAGSDFFVMPSRYEPCGLNQMYSMRYGTLPLVRATGGLDDTVINYNADAPEHSSGFKFWDLTTDALTGTMKWAASVYTLNPYHYRLMQKKAMETDFSWNHTAAEYEQMYKDAHR